MTERANKRKRDADVPLVTYYAPGRTFDRLFKESSLNEMKNVVRTKLGLALGSSIQLAQIRDGRVIDLEDDDDFDAFASVAYSSSLVNVRVTADSLPEHNSPAPSATENQAVIPAPTGLEPSDINSPESRRVSFLQTPPNVTASTSTIEPKKKRAKRNPSLSGNGTTPTTVNDPHPATNGSMAVSTITEQTMPSTSTPNTTVNAGETSNDPTAGIGSIASRLSITPKVAGTSISTPTPAVTAGSEPSASSTATVTEPRGNGGKKDTTSKKSSATDGPPPPTVVQGLDDANPAPRTEVVVTQKRSKISKNAKEQRSIISPPKEDNSDNRQKATVNKTTADKLNQTMDGISSSVVDSHNQEESNTTANGGVTELKRKRTKSVSKLPRTVTAVDDQNNANPLKIRITSRMLSKPSSKPVSLGERPTPGSTRKRFMSEKPQHLPHESDIENPASTDDQLDGAVLKASEVDTNKKRTKEAVKKLKGKPKQNKTSDLVVGKEKNAEVSNPAGDKLSKSRDGNEPHSVDGAQTPKSGSKRVKKRHVKETHVDETTAKPGGEDSQGKLAIDEAKTLTNQVVQEILAKRGALSTTQASGATKNHRTTLDKSTPTSADIIAPATPQESQPKEDAPTAIGASGELNRRVSAKKVVTQPRTCKICFKSPMHPQYKCPIVTSGVDSMKGRIVELEKDVSTDTEDRRVAAIKILLGFLGKGIKTRSQPSKVNENLIIPSLQSTLIGDGGSSSNAVARIAGGSGNTEKLNVARKSSLRPLGSDISEHDSNEEEDSFSSIEEFSDGDAPVSLSAQKFLPTPLPQISGLSDIPGIDLDALIRGPSAKLKISDILSSAESDDEPGDLAVEEDDNENRRKFRRMKKRYVEDSSDEEDNEADDLADNVKDRNDDDDTSNEPGQVEVNDPPLMVAEEEEADISFHDVDKLGESEEIDNLGDIASNNALADDTAIFKLKDNDSTGSIGVQNASGDKDTETSPHEANHSNPSLNNLHPSQEQPTPEPNAPPRIGENPIETEANPTSASRHRGSSHHPQSDSESIPFHSTPVPRMSQRLNERKNRSQPNSVTRGTGARVEVDEAQTSSQGNRQDALGSRRTTRASHTNGKATNTPARLVKYSRKGKMVEPEVAPPSVDGHDAMQDVILDRTDPSVAIGATHTVEATSAEMDTSTDLWETLPIESSPSFNGETSQMVDELHSGMSTPPVPQQSLSRTRKQTRKLNETKTRPNKRLSSNLSKSPLFNPAESQRPFPFSQWQSPHHSEVHVNAHSPDDSDDEEEVEASVKSQTSVYPRLTDLAGRNNFLKPSPSLRPAIFETEKAKRNDMYGEIGDEQGESESGTDSDSASENERASHIPKYRLAGTL